MVLPIKCMPLVKKMPTDFSTACDYLLDDADITLFTINAFGLKAMMV